MENPTGYLDELNTRLEKLKIGYDLFFRGVNKREPLSEREGLRREILRFNPNLFSQLKHKFRFRQIARSFQTYQDLWDRQMRKLEGTSD